MLPILREKYADTGINPHFEIDGHYNVTGHEIIAEVLYDFLKNKNILSEEYLL